MSRSRNWCFTLNNYTDADEEKFQQVECKYIVYGREVGESGTPHLQGTIVFVDAKSLKSVQKIDNKAHWEFVKFIHSSIIYCKKDSDIYESGILPLSAKEKGEKSVEVWNGILQMAREDRIREISAEVQLRMGRALRLERDEASALRTLEETEEVHLWYYGGAGTGKSRKARSDHPSAYLKMCNKWWDGYRDHEVVLLEDLDKRHEVLIHHLKIWADRYPFLAEYKGGAKVIRPKLVIVTSNYHPTDIWSDPKDLLPIVRRFKIVHFCDLFVSADM